MDQLKVGDRVKIKHGTSWLPVPAGTKGIVTGTGVDGKVLYVLTERGSSYWINPEDLEPDDSPPPASGKENL